MSNTPSQSVDPWERHVMALDEVTDRMNRITTAFDRAGVPYALIGGQAVAIWVATRDPAAVRTTKDVDILLDRNELPKARDAADTVGLEYYEVSGVGMFLERTDQSPKRAVHVIWAGERVREHDLEQSPHVSQATEIESDMRVLPLCDLVCMKLIANRRHDQVHLQDMIAIGLIKRADIEKMPESLRDRLRVLFDEG